jgi:hypothetical protein
VLPLLVEINKPSLVPTKIFGESKNTPAAWHPPPDALVYLRTKFVPPLFENHRRL